jgi:hypothetical protein
VPSDVDDFVRFVAMLAQNYFVRPNYLTVAGRSYLSIYDSTFFVLELGVANARNAITAARAWLREHGHRDLHLAAIEPNAEVLPLVRDVGFDSVTHYVLLPDCRTIASTLGAAPANGRTSHARRGCRTCPRCRRAGTRVPAAPTSATHVPTSTRGRRSWSANIPNTSPRRCSVRTSSVPTGPSTIRWC